MLASNAGGPGSIPGGGPKILHARRHGEKKYCHSQNTFLKTLPNIQSLHSNWVMGEFSVLHGRYHCVWKQAQSSNER